MASGAPLAYYVVTSGVAVLALAVSVINFKYTQSKNDERELVKWRRDALTKLMLPVFQEIESIRRDIDKPIVNIDALVARVGELATQRDAFLVLGFNNFAEQYKMLLSSMGSELHSRLHEPGLHFWLMSEYIPTISGMLMIETTNALSYKHPSKPRLLSQKYKSRIDHFFRPFPSKKT